MALDLTFSDGNVLFSQPLTDIVFAINTLISDSADITKGQNKLKSQLQNYLTAPFSGVRDTVISDENLELTTASILSTASVIYSSKLNRFLLSYNNSGVTKYTSKWSEGTNVNYGILPASSVYNNADTTPVPNGTKVYMYDGIPYIYIVSSANFVPLKTASADEVTAFWHTNASQTANFVKSGLFVNSSGKVVSTAVTNGYISNPIYVSKDVTYSITGNTSAKVYISNNATVNVGDTLTLVETTVSGSVIKFTPTSDCRIVVCGANIALIITASMSLMQKCKDDVIRFNDKLEAAYSQVIANANKISENKVDIVSLTEIIGEAEETIEAHGETLEDIDARLEEDEDTISSINSTLSTVSTKANTNAQNISSIQSKLGTLAANTTVAGELTSIRSLVTNNTSDISALSETVAENEAAIAEHTDTISDHESRLADVEEIAGNAVNDIVSVNSNIANHTQQITQAKTDIVQNTAAISTLDESLTDTITRIDGIDDNISDIVDTQNEDHDKLNTVSGQVDELSSTVDENTANILEQADNIVDHESRLATLETKPVMSLTAEEITKLRALIASVN